MAARRRHSNRRRRGGSFGFLYKLLSVLVICGAVVLALTLFFRVDTVVCTGMERYTAAEVSAATGVETGDNLVLMNKYDVAQSIVKALPYIKNVRISRKFPDTLLIEVTECGTPMALIQDGFAWLVSPGDQASGKVKIVDQLAESDAVGYGVIDGCALLAPSVGGQLALATEYASQQQSLSQLLYALEDASLMDQVDAIHLEDLSVLRMEYLDRFTVELPYGADYGRKLLILQVAVGKLETNMTGTIQLTRSDETVHFIQQR